MFLKLKLRNCLFYQLKSIDINGWNNINTRKYSTPIIEKALIKIDIELQEISFCVISPSSTHELT